MNPSVSDHHALPNSSAALVPSALHFEARDVALCFTRSGTLLPWLGPALRGITALALKRRACRHPAAEQDGRWRHCRGCPHMGGCAYGETFEPDPPPGLRCFDGQDDASRPLVIAPLMLPAPRVARGQHLPVRITGLGPSAPQHLDQVVAALAEAGQTVGIGPEHVRFELQTLSQPFVTALRPAALPACVDGSRTAVPQVRVALFSPLYLRTKDDRGQRRAISRPGFADLLRASLRTVGQLFRLYAQPLEADFAGLKEAAVAVRCQQAAWQPFRQRKWSNRTEQRFELRGVTGSATFAGVPAALVPWLVWGGRLHAGGHRVAGAGGWSVRAE